MTLHRHHRRAPVLAAACLVAGFQAPAFPSRAESRPSPSAACHAWHGHIADLIDQHRVANEIDENALGDIIRLFYEAQSACWALRFDEGLAIYETIPLGPVASRRLR